MRYPPIKTPNPVFRKSMTYNNILKCMGGVGRLGRVELTLRMEKFCSLIFSMVPSTHMEAYGITLPRLPSLPWRRQVIDFVQPQPPVVMGG